MQLFQDVAAVEKQHPIYKLIRQPQYGPERAVLERWADGFIDRDQKFVREFQGLPHAKERPFVIAIASFDQPFAHMAASRPILSAIPSQLVAGVEQREKDVSRHRPHIARNIL